MVNRSNVRKLIIISVGFILALVGAAGYIIYHGGNSSKKELPPKIVQENRETQDSSSKEEAVTKNSSEKSEEESSKIVVDFLKVYSSWELNASSIDERQDKLQSLMTEKGYQNLHIAEDAISLKLMIEAFEKDKTINTSNSSQLVSRSYIKSKVFQDASNKALYYVELYYTECPIYQEKGYPVVAKINLSVQDSKVDALEVTDIKALPGGEKNNGGNS